MHIQTIRFGRLPDTSSSTPSSARAAPDVEDDRPSPVVRFEAARPLGEPAPTPPPTSGAAPGSERLSASYLRSRGTELVSLREVADRGAPVRDPGELWAVRELLAASPLTIGDAAAAPGPAIRVGHPVDTRAGGLSPAAQALADRVAAPLKDFLDFGESSLSASEAARLAFALRLTPPVVVDQRADVRPGDRVEMVDAESGRGSRGVVVSASRTFIAVLCTDEQNRFACRFVPSSQASSLRVLAPAA